MEHEANFWFGISALVFGGILAAGAAIYYEREMKGWSNNGEVETASVIIVAALGGVLLAFGAYDVLSNLSITLTGDPLRLLP